jgi:hypothetical protein
VIYKSKSSSPLLFNVFATAPTSPFRGSNSGFVGRGIAPKYLVLKHSRAEGRLLGSNLSIHPSNSNSASPAAENVPARPPIGFGRISSLSVHPGSNRIPGHSASLGVPRARKIMSNWCSSLSAGRYGVRNMSSANMHPAAHMSTPAP